MIETVYDNELALDEAIAEFLRADASGRAGDRQQWLDRYPRCASGLREFFDDHDRINKLATPIIAEGLSDSSDLRRTTNYDSLGYSAAPPEFAAPRYRPLRFHARGGMGEVWLARDEQIGRQVALKKLRTEDAAAQARFLVEAQVTGQLEHPGVVPLHDLGQDDAGRPYYVMKFIHGRSLGQAIEEYHARRDLPQPSADLEFLRLIEAFISVCNAVAYAHSKGVLHRDIKPSNVMLGPYGETLVLDWGLAKVMARREEEGGHSAVRVTASDSSVANDGGIVGTPVYMSPEEAHGNAEAIDQASDVYLLGATLYEILTGRPPRQGSSKWELLDQARKARPVAPRKLDAQIPRALEAICLKAMAFDKPDRYASATALAEDVERYLAGEPTVAYREPWPQRVARWARRHRRGILQGMLIGGVVVLSVAAASAYRRAELLAAQEHARAQWREFRRLADESQFYAANDDAVSERVPYYHPRRARQLGEAALAVAAAWGPRGERLPLVELRTEALRARHELTLLLARLNLQSAGADHNPRTALALLDAAREAQAPSRGYFQLRAQCLALLGEQEAARHDLQRAGQDDTAVSASDHFLAGELLRVQDAGAAFDRHLAAPRRERLAQAVDEYRAALRLDPRHYWAQYQRGRCLLALGRSAEAVEALAACVAMRPDAPWAYASRGLALALAGSPDEGLVDLDRALQLSPAFPPARLNLGVVYWLRGDTAAALAEFGELAAAPADKRLIEAVYYRGQLLWQSNRATEALADASLVIDARPDFRPAYWLRALAHFHLGSDDDAVADVARHEALGQPSPAAGLEPRVGLGGALRRLAVELEGDARRRALQSARRALGDAVAAGSASVEAFEHLGAAHEALGALPQAIDAYSRGLALAPGRVPLLNLRGWARAATQQFELAREDFAEALRLEPDNAEARVATGYVLAETGAGAEAQAQSLAALLVGADNYLVVHDVACVFARLAREDSDSAPRLEDMAIAALRRAIALWRRQPGGPDELELIRREVAFSEALRARPEFQQLLAEDSHERPSQAGRTAP